MLFFYQLPPPPPPKPPPENPPPENPPPPNPPLEEDGGVMELESELKECIVELKCDIHKIVVKVDVL